MDLTLENKEDIKELIDVAKKKSTLDEIDYIVDHEELISKTVNKCFENKNDIKDINNNSINNKIIDKALDHENLTKYISNNIKYIKPVVKTVTNHLRKHPDTPKVIANAAEEIGIKAKKYFNVDEVKQYYQDNKEEINGMANSIGNQVSAVMNKFSGGTDVDDCNIF